MQVICTCIDDMHSHELFAVLMDLFCYRKINGMLYSFSDISDLVVVYCYLA